jgi:hypothetical protein
VKYAIYIKSCPNCRSYLQEKEKKKQGILIPTPWRKVSQTGARFDIFLKEINKKLVTFAFLLVCEVFFTYMC